MFIVQATGVFVPSKPLQPGMIFVDKARSLPVEGCTREAPRSVLFRKYQTRLERLVRNKHSSLFCRNIDDKKYLITFANVTKFVFFVTYEEAV